MVAVLTGDIVGSSTLSAARLAEVLAAIGQAVEDFAKAHPDALVGKAEFFRGDAWQLAMSDPAGALRLALLIRARLAAADLAATRLAIGVGNAEIHPTHITRSTGEAFVLSGRALDGIEVQYRMTGALPERAGALRQWFPALIQLCDAQVSRWKPEQAETVAYALMAPTATHQDIGKMFAPSKTQQAVSKALAGAGWKALADAMAALETTAWDTLLQPI